MSLQILHDKGLTTAIDWKDQDAAGHTLSAEKRTQMNRLRTWQERIRTKNASERNLQFALGEIDRMASALGVPHSEGTNDTYRNRSKFLFGVFEFLIRPPSEC